MAYSAALKAHLLAARDLVLRAKVELKNDDGSWIDFTDRDPVIGTVSVQGDRDGHRITSTTASISFTNDDGYFDYMDDPASATTIALFGTLASKFSRGFKDIPIRVSAVILLPSGSWEAAPLGVFRLKTRGSDPATQRVTFALATDIDDLKKIGIQALSDGYKQYNNRPVSFLIRAILGRKYPGGITASEFTIPNKVTVSSADGEPAFSHYGKPPELDTAGRWRDDILAAPTCMYYHAASGYFYVGVGDEVWRMSPTTELWESCGSFGDDNVLVKGIYEMTSTRLLVVGWEYKQDTRHQILKTAQITTGSGTMTTNDPGYWHNIYSGEMVLRDTYHSGASGSIDPLVGYVANYSSWVGLDALAGINMPCPFPQWPHLGIGDYPDNKAIAITDGPRVQPASGDWTTFAAAASPPHGLSNPEPCYLSAVVVRAPTTTERPLFRAFWGMRPSLVYVPSFLNAALTDTPWVMFVGTDGDPLGIRCAGEIWIAGIKAYSGADYIIGPGVGGTVTGARAPFYDLRYYGESAASKDWLTWIEIDWVEEWINVATGGTPANCDNPIARIVRSEIYDDGSGGPEIDPLSEVERWKAGDNELAADDSAYIPTHALCFEISGTAHWLVQILDTAAVGGDCFELFYCDDPITYNAIEGGGTNVSLGSSKYGWGGFSLDATGQKIYFIERDTGRACFVDISSGPTEIEVLHDGQEPVAQAHYEIPSAQDSIVIRVESSKTCLYSLSYPALPGIVYEARTWPAGKYYLWKDHPQLTDRIELFDEGELSAWDALGLLAEAVDYMVGMDPEGVGFFSPKPTSADSDAFTLDLDSSDGLVLSAVKYDGLDEIVNRSEFIPYEVTIGLPEASLDLIGYLDGTAQKYYNGETEIRSESILETVISLVCIKEGDPGTAAFKYLIHESLVQTTLREDTTISTYPRRIRVESNTDLEAGMLVQIGDVDEAGGVPYSIDSIEADGDVILNQDLAADHSKGEAVIFRKANNAIWSTDYAAPATYTAATSLSEIGETGLFLKFTAAASPQRFAVGDRIIVKNPGQSLERSKVQKFTVENTASREEHGLSEYNFNNKFMSFTIGKERSGGEVSAGAQPRHGWKIVTTLLIQAKVNTLVKVRSSKLLPLAASNEERCRVTSVIHDSRNARTTLELRGLSSY